VTLPVRRGADGRRPPRSDRIGTSALRAFLLLACCFAAAPSSAQESEVIYLDEPAAAAPSPAAAAEEAEIVPLPAQGIDSREVLSGLWFRYRALADRQQRTEADRLVRAALDFMKREGLRSAPEIASAFQSQARLALAEGEFERAKGDFRRALQFDPNLAVAHRGLALALLRGDGAPVAAVAEWWRGAVSVIRDPESLFLILGNLALVLHLGLCFGTIAALLLMLWRSAPALIHDLQERSQSRLSGTTAQVLGWLLLALPLLVPIPPAWVIAAWGALFFSYLRGADRAVAVAALLLLVSAGPVGRFLAWHFGTATDPVARALMQSIRTGPDLRHEAALRDVIVRHPDQPLFPFLLGSAYRAGGHFEESMEMYRSVLAVEPLHARAMVNLGNLHALRHEFALAQNLYKGAAEADPTMALAHFNSHLAHLESFRMEEADAALGRARAIDEALIARLLDESGSEAARRSVQDTTYTPREIWDKVLELDRQDPIGKMIARALTTSSTVAGGAGLLTALLLPGIGLTPRRGAARRCRRCGRAFCRRCHVATKAPDYCSQCTHLFILRDGLAPAVRDRKTAEVVRYRRQTVAGMRLLSLVLPGSGHVLGGRALLGALLLCGWATALVRIALDDRLLGLPGYAAARGHGDLLIAPIALGLIAWLGGSLTSQESHRG
jgi:tetratricopeptide (TPR) repeat protein